ncbi:MAG: dodecin family protein, partial [Pseudomonadota bacterium]
SKKSFQDAVEKGIARANKTLKNVEGAWIKDQSVVLDKGEINILEGLIRAGNPLFDRILKALF